MAAKKGLPKFSQTTIVLLGSLGLISAISLFTAYTYFLSSAPREPVPIAQKKLYNESINEVISQLSSYEVYNIEDVQVETEIGRENPFEPF